MTNKFLTLLLVIGAVGSVLAAPKFDTETAAPDATENVGTSGRDFRIKFWQTCPDNVNTEALAAATKVSKDTKLVEKIQEDSTKMDSLVAKIGAALHALNQNKTNIPPVTFDFEGTTSPNATDDEEDLFLQTGSRMQKKVAKRTHRTSSAHSLRSLRSKTRIGVEALSGLLWDVAQRGKTLPGSYRGVQELLQSLQELSCNIGKFKSVEAQLNEAYPSLLDRVKTLADSCLELRQTCESRDWHGGQNVVQGYGVAWYHHLYTFGTLYIASSLHAVGARTGYFFHDQFAESPSEFLRILEGQRDRLAIQITIATQMLLLNKINVVDEKVTKLAKDVNAQMGGAAVGLNAVAKSVKKSS